MTRLELELKKKTDAATAAARFRVRRTGLSQRARELFRESKETELELDGAPCGRVRVTYGLEGSTLRLYKVDESWAEIVNDDEAVRVLEWLLDEVPATPRGK